ncbi:hypothetical protein ACOI22_01560 [Glaciecola sp. 2405UD65-10]|uniref:hypothetical protein n=1 Tax=Glaciecola sp. 2405UD65-10 TaxID=3397244 RepID=UPI003B5C844E
MSKLDKETVLENFTQAYTKANGKAPSVEAKGGWYSVDGGKNIRLAQLEELTEELSGQTKVSDEKPSKKTAAKKETKKKASPKKSKTPSFSVKDFYTQQIQDANPGAKAPR